MGFALGLFIGLAILVWVVAAVYSMGGTDDEGAFDE